MPYDPSRITYLLQRYTAKSCTKEELEELFAVIAAAENDDTLHQFMEAEFHRFNGEEAFPQIDTESVYASIVKKEPRRIFTLPRVAAAAAVLLLATWWFTQQPKKSAPQIVEQQKRPILPGSNKATLTLADGSTVTLDSTGNQVISRGDTKISQQNGQLLYSSAGKTAEGYNKLSTPRGGQFRVVLPDGTKVWLNSASSLRYPMAFTGKERIVELEGQGYFEVAQNAEQPFKVKAHEMEVQVLGTHFDIMAYADENTVNTTLLEGAVQVKEGNTARLLKPGQQAILKSHAFTVQEADVKRVIAWKNGLFVFNDMALPAILREVARWYDVEIVYETTPGTELYGGGLARNLHLSNVLTLLEGSGFNHFRVEGRKVIVLP
ncbi:FecR domain-containing protein [Chitinophaga niabensis]|uniref:FecR family protein n=1 Tax=Chitinophaga niabensis TaxID=536979 RepID=UPI0031BAB5C5